MKLTTVLLIVTMLQVSAAGLAQNITFIKKQATLKQLFTAINKQTGYDILLAGNNVKSIHLINAQFNNTPLPVVLKTALQNLSLEFDIREKSIVITDKVANIDKEKNTDVKDSILTVKGQVIDEKGKPLPGASVKLFNPNKTAVVISTDAEGRFTLLADRGSIIMITYIGYEDYQLKVKTASLGAISLIPKSNELSEVKVIVGYGTTTKALNTGSVVSINSADIARQPVTNVLQALQGMVPGLTVNQTSGFASASFNVKIRGQNSLTSTASNGINNLSEPLFIVDGVPVVSGGNSSSLNSGINKNGFTGPTEGQSPIYGLNPTDIESISILKDADATAIYGARGANGVILITTKKGKAGPTSVSANVYTGLSLQTKKLDLMNTQQYLEMRKRAFANDKIEPNSGNAYDLLTWDQNRYVNWQKELLSTAHTTDAQLSLSGGDARTTFRISGGFNRSSPPFIGDYKEQRASGSLAITNQAFNNKLTTVATINFSSTTSNLPSFDPTSLIFLPPNAPDLLDSEGNLNFKGYAASTSYPDAAIGIKRIYSANTKNLISNLNLKYQLLPGLYFNTSFGYNLSRQDQLQKAPRGSYDPLSTKSSFATFGNNNSQVWIIEPNLTFHKSIQKHNFTALLGSTFQDTRTDGNRIDATGYSDDAFLESLAGASAYSVRSNYINTRFESLYARVNYNYDEKYVLTLNGRRDGSSRFGDSKRFGDFGSVGAAWIFTNEDFVKNKLSFLSFGKIRASYGLLGSDEIPDYQYLSSFTNGQYAYQNTPTYQLSRLGNPEFSWTTNKKAEAAVALGFLDGRINTEFAFYRNLSGNQLVVYLLAATSGFSTVIANLPAEVQNQGWEFTLQTNNIKTKNFSWSTSLNLSRNRNKLLSFPGIKLSPYANTYAVGRSINSVGMYKYTGVDAATGNYTFADINGDGSVDLFGNTDYIYKDTSPAIFGGMNNSFSYKDFQLSFLFNFTKQRSILRLSNVAAGGVIQSLGNQLILSEQLSGKPALENLTTQVYRSNLLAYNNSDAVFVDASYIRLQNLSISYNLPGSLLKRSGLQGLRFYMQGQNILTITGFRGPDPEQPSSFSLPARKIITAGIQITL